MCEVLKSEILSNFVFEPGSKVTLKPKIEMEFYDLHSFLSNLHNSVFDGRKLQSKCFVIHIEPF